MSRIPLMTGSESSSKHIRLFRSDLLEKLTVISPWGFAAVWGMALPAIAWAGWGSISAFVGCSLFAFGLLVWLLFEYAMHRCLFHWESRSELIHRFVFIMHGNHHVDPNDKMRNLMPPVVSLPIGGMVWAACVSFLGLVGTWVFLGFIVGYVVYDVTHYACHQWPMKGHLAHMLKRHHMRHHYAAMGGNYAITALFLDRLFGTLITSLKRSS